MPSALRFETADTDDLSAAELEALHQLVAEAFPGEFTEHDWQHCLGGLHSIAWDGNAPVGHTALVPRQMRIARQTVHVGYVEGVAVATDRRRQGIGRQLMTPVHDSIHTDFDLGALATTDEAITFYRALGWWPWLGTLWVDAPDGHLRTADEDGGIYAYPGRMRLNLNALRHEELTCDWRGGDVW